MSPAVVVATILAGAVGAVARYLVAAGWAARRPTRPRDGVAAVNALGCFALGVVVTTVSAPSVRAVLTLGLLGGFTTFSTWLVNALTARALARDVLLHLAVGLPAALAGLAAGSLTVP